MNEIKLVIPDSNVASTGAISFAGKNISVRGESSNSFVISLLSLVARANATVCVVFQVAVSRYGC